MLDDTERQRIEKIFLATWDEAERWYTGLQAHESSVAIVASICLILQKMREAGYDYCFRLDYLDNILLLSRTVTPTTTLISLKVTHAEMLVYAKILDKEYILPAQPIELSHELKLLIELLMNQAIG